MQEKKQRNKLLLKMKPMFLNTICWLKRTLGFVLYTRYILGALKHLGLAWKDGEKQNTGAFRPLTVHGVDMVPVFISINTTMQQHSV